MIYKTIAIIGIGTLGGFVADAIANTESLENLILIDHDIIESKNLINSIYRPIDIGLQKTQALTDILKSKHTYLNIIPKKEKFIEGVSVLPECDLVLDCRDYTYDRRQEIDVRLYISSRYLIVDCRKNVFYKVKTEGKYLTELSKEDLRYAGSLVSMLLVNDTIKYLLKNKIVQKYELDYVKHLETCSYDIVYENGSNEGKIVNLPEKIVPILQANVEYDLPVFVGSSLFPIAEHLIPKNTLRSSNDLMIKLSEVLSTQCEFNNFVISLHHVNGKILIELIPETGAA